MIDYYKKKLFLVKIDKNDKFVDQVERWQAHKQGILHRGFTTILTYKRQVLLQQRKHPSFDGLYDLTFSSHPVFIDGVLQSMEEAIYNTLEREWKLIKKDLNTDLRYLDKFYYQARDPKSIYTEHEVDYLYIAELNRLPEVNQDFAYGYELVNLEFSPDFQLAPWAETVKKLLNV